MWTRLYSKFYSGVSAEAIWRAWVDINNWSNWHGDLEYCRFEGAFVAGNHFRLKPKTEPAVKIILTEVDEGRSFTDCTKFLGARMYDTHSIEVKDDGVLLSNKLIVKGPLSWLWIKLVAKHIAETIPQELDALVGLVGREGDLR